MKINPTGGLLWQKAYGGDNSDRAYAVAAAPNGGSTIVSSSSSSASGNVTGTNHGSVDFWILNLDAAGNLTSQKLYGGSQVDTPYSVHQTSDGGFMVAGASGSSASGDVTGTNHAVTGGADVWLLKFSSAGNLQWQRLYGGGGNDGSNVMTLPQSKAVEARQTPDGGYIVSATSRSSQSGDVTDKANNPAGSTNINDCWLFKIDASGNIVTVPDVGQR